MVVVIVVGPKEIPNLLRQLGKASKSLKKISREFKHSLNELAEEGDLKDVKDSITSIKNIKKDLDPTALQKDLDPTGELKKEFSSINQTINTIDKDIKNNNSKNK